MTREEAKGNLIHAFRWNDMPKKEALAIAIVALKAEPCEDCISRESVLDVLRTMYDTHIVETEDGDEYIDYNDTVYEVEQLPSVTPARRKIGHWIDLNDKDEWFCSVYKCSVCGHETLDHEGFCSKCGSRMEVEK